MLASSSYSVLPTAAGKAENFSLSNTFVKFIGFNKLFPKHLARTLSSNQHLLYHAQKVFISSHLPSVIYISCQKKT